MVKTIVLVFFVILSIPNEAWCVVTNYLTSGSARIRALSMASAYTSIEDDFSAGFYNPGAFKVNATRNERSFRFFFNPVGVATGLYDFRTYDTDYERDEELTVKEGLYSLATILKGAVYTTSVFDVGFGLWEEVIPFDTTATETARSGRFFSYENLMRQSFHSAFFNIKIAPSVSFGLSGTLFSERNHGDITYSSGHTFGIMLNPNPKMKVGIAYNFLPKQFSNARVRLESIENETITSGISYYPDLNTVLSIDLRNLTREDKATSREIHTGIERKITDLVAIRAGYYRKKTTKNDVLSFGIGILPKKEEISKYATSSRNDTLSYTVILEEDGSKRQWHMLSLLLRY